MNRRKFLQAAVATVALTTGLAKTSLSLIEDEDEGLKIYQSREMMKADGYLTYIGVTEGSYFFTSDGRKSRSW